MKKKALCFFLVSLSICSAYKSQIVVTPASRNGGSPEFAIFLNGGDMNRMKDAKLINIVYDYSNMAVGGFEHEEDYLQKKTNDYNKKDPGRGEKFRESWYNDRAARFEPKFLELFSKYISPVGIRVNNYQDNGDVTLTVHTVFTEPGFNVGITKMPSTIDLECIFRDKDGNELVKYIIRNAEGYESMGFDFDTGTRLSESYAKAGKMLAKDVAWRIKRIRKQEAKALKKKQKLEKEQPKNNNQ